MPIPVDIVPKIDQSSATLAGNLLRGHFSGVGRDVAGEFSRNFHRGMEEGFKDISGSFGMLGRVAEGTFSKITSTGGMAALGVAGIGVAALGVGKQLYDLGEQWHEVTVEMAVRSGKLGDDLKSLTDSVKTTAIETAAPIADIGDVAARVTQSLHLAGEPLIRMTKTIADLNEMTGEKLNIRELGKAFRLFGVDIEKNGIDQLNSLENASQATGIPLNDLINTMTGKGAAAAKEFNLNFGQTAGLITSFEQAGVPTDAINGLAIALKKISIADLGPRITEIKRLADIGDSEGAKKLAAGTFGKGFVFFLDAIKTGAVDAQSLNTQLQGTGHTIDEMRQKTETWHGEWQKTINSLKVELEPAAESVFRGIGGMMDQYLIRPFHEFNNLISGAADLWHKLFGGGEGTPGPTGVPGVPATIGTDPGAAVGPPAVQGPGIMQPGTGTPGSNPLDVFAPTSGGGHPGSAQFGGGGSGLPSPAAMAGIAKAQAMNGLPYVPGTQDCSGYISQVYSAMSGTQTHFSTETFNGPALGWHRGFMPGALNVGIKHGGPGGGHMAGTLPNGVNIESGGSSGGVSYGSGPGAQGGQFTEQWWFMPGYQIGGAVGNFNPDHPTGGGNINPGIQIDTSRADVGQASAWRQWADAMMGGFENMHLFSPGVPGLNQWISNKLGRYQLGGSTDTVHAMLTPGEHVLTVDDVAELGGQQGVYALRSALHRNGGGDIGFDVGGGVFDPNSPTSPNMQNDMTQSFLSGMQQGGGYGGMIASFIQMGMAGKGKGPGGQQPGMPGGGPPPISSGMGAGPLPGPPPVQGYSPASVGGTGMTGLGAVDMAGGMAAMMPGMGTAAQMGSKLANRAIGFAGQAISIGIQGVAETFLPHGSALGDPSRNWLGKIASGIGGGRPAGENTSGKTDIAMPIGPPPGSPASGQGSGPAPGPAIGEVNFHSPVQDQQSMLRDIDRLYSSKMNAHGAGSAP